MKNKAKNPRRLSVVLVSILLAVLVAVNVGGGMFFNVITQFFSVVKVDEQRTGETAAVARGVVEQIESEGIVLLENNGALPLNTDNEKEKKVNVFGWASISPVYGGGVGSSSSYEENAVSLYKGLENAGFAANSELFDFYENSGLKSLSYNRFGDFVLDYTIYGMAAKDYPEALLANAKDYSDVALIVIGRNGGEGGDVAMDMSKWEGEASKHYLELSDKEEDMIDMVTAIGFKKVVLLINSIHSVELGFLEEKNIDAAVWIGGPGETGMNAVANMLKGEVNPSGRLVDTYAYDFMSAPAFANTGDFIYSGTGYDNYDHWTDTYYTDYHQYLNYAEGIYVGYRYYETRYVDNVTGQVDEEAYQNAVQYPFGYGLSYTSFDQRISDFKSDDKTVTMSVQVTNTGQAAGKDVVQVYYTPPYTIGGIEKSHVVLADFGKTDLLAPGTSQTIDIAFDIEDMASFDYGSAGCYVLEGGTYGIKLMKNAHEVIDSRDFVLDHTITYDENNKRSSDEIPAVSRFADVQSDITYVSRADWEGTIPVNPPREKTGEPEILAAMTNYAPEEDLSAEDIVLKNNGLRLQDMIGLNYEDPKWNSLLEQLSVSDMQNLIGFGGYATQVVKSVGKPYTIDLDGPTGINALVNLSDAAYKSTAYTSVVVLACTWNQDLARQMGESYGAEADAWGISGIYGPSMNIHRTSLGGRNYEYYSEDGTLSGKMAAAVTAGIRSQNVYGYIKHFAMYEQPGGGACVWSNEQAIRELYLRPFETCVKEGGAAAVMSSFNRIGSSWTGASHALLTDVLRSEWGFRGMVVTDYVDGDYMSVNQGIRAGNDLMLTTTGCIPTDTSNAGKQAMRTASHNILYTVANSNAMEIDNYGPTPYWFYILIGVDAAAVCLSGLFFFCRNKKRRAYAAQSGKEE